MRDDDFYLRSLCLNYPLISLCNFSKTTASPQAKKKGKEARSWGGGKVDVASLDYSSGSSPSPNVSTEDNDLITESEVSIVCFFFLFISTLIMLKQYNI